MTVAVAQLARALVRGWVLLVACVVIGALAGLAVASSSDAVYRAETALVVQSDDTPDPGATRIAVNSLAESAEVRRATAELFEDASARLEDRLFFAVLPGQPGLLLQAEGASPSEAERLVGAYRDAMLGASRSLPARADGAPVLVAVTAPTADARRVRPRVVPATVGAALLSLVIGLALLVWRRPG